MTVIDSIGGFRAIRQSATLLSAAQTIALPSLSFAPSELPTIPTLEVRSSEVSSMPFSDNVFKSNLGRFEKLELGNKGG